MRIRNALLGLLLTACGVANAATIAVGSATASTAGGATTPATIQATYTADATTVGFQMRILFNGTRLTAAVAPNGASYPGITCQVNSAGTANAFVFIFYADAGGNVIPSGNLCGLTFTVGAGAAGTLPLDASLNMMAGDGCFDVNAAATTCTVTDGAITVSGAPADTSPNLAYNPASGGAITLTAAGPNATGVIVVTPSGGTGAATTTFGSCSFAANTASMATTPPTLTFTGNTTTAQNRDLTCVRQAAAVTALLTCQETQSDGTPAGPQPRTFNVTCPAAAATGTAPTVVVGPGGPFSLSAGAVGGTATGDVTVNVTGAGTTPGSLALACTIPAGANSFTITGGANRTINAPAALGANAPPIGVSCVRTAAAATSTLTCAQTATPGPNPANQTVSIICPAGAPVPTPVFSSTPPAGTTISLNGTQGGPPATGLVTVSNTVAGTTLTVTPSGLTAPLSVSPAGATNIAGGASQAFTVSCATGAVGAFNQTLTFTTNDPARPTVTFPVTCNIIAGGAGTQATAVPTLSPAGKLIAIFSVLGLGLLGFAVTRRA